MLPHAEHVMMRGVGHVPMWDNPEHVARVLLRGSAPVAEVAPLSLVGGTRRAIAPRRHGATRRPTRAHGDGGHPIGAASDRP